MKADEITNELYAEMMTASPIQKELGEVYAPKLFHKRKEYCPTHHCLYVQGSDTYDCPAFRSVEDDVNTNDSRFDGNPTKEGYKKLDDNRCKEWVYLLTQEDWQEIYEQKKTPALNVKTFAEFHKNNYGLLPCPEVTESISKTYTMLWCLFVHKEVYGLVWDFEHSVWQNVKA